MILTLIEVSFSSFFAVKSPFCTADLLKREFCGAEVFLLRSKASQHRQKKFYVLVIYRNFHKFMLSQFAFTV